MNVRSRIIAVSIGLMIAGTSNVSAQMTAPAGGASSLANVPSVLTLDGAIKLAMERNYTIRTTTNDHQHAEMEVSRTKDALLPTASASGSYGYNYSLQPASEREFVVRDPITGAVIGTNSYSASTHSLNYNIGASFNIFNGGGDAARIKVAGASLDAAAGNLSWLRQEIAFSVTTDFVNVLRTRELVGAADKTLAEAQAQLSRVKGQYDAGSIPIAQVYQQEALVGQNELSLIQARNTYENAKADLLYLLDVPPNAYAKYDVSLGGIDTATDASHLAKVDAADADSKIGGVLESRPDFVAQRSQIDASEASLSITRSLLYPSLSASLGIGGSGNNESLGALHMTHSISAGLSLRIPIFDAFQNRISLDEQSIDIESQRIRLNGAEQQLRSDVAKALNNLRGSEQALDASDRALRSSEESRRLATERLAVGAGIQVDVIVAESAVETARSNRVNAKYNYVLAKKQLEYTLGNWSY